MQSGLSNTADQHRTVESAHSTLEALTPSYGSPPTPLVALNRWLRLGNSHPRKERSRLWANVGFSAQV